MRYLLAALALVLDLILSLVADVAHAQEPDRLLEAQADGRNEPLDVVIADNNLNQTGPVWWSDSFSQLGTDYLRLHIRVLRTDADSDAVVTIEGIDDRRYTYKVVDIGQQGVWTELMPQGQATVSIEGERRPANLILNIDQMSFQADAGLQYSVWGDNNETKQVNDHSVPDLVWHLMGPVAKLVFQSQGMPRTCTGFLIGKSTLLTNQHCINSDESCSSLSAMFGYEYGPNNRLLFGKQYHCAGFVPSRSNYDLDVTAIELKGNPGDEYGTLALSDPGAQVSGPLIIIQHPGGKPKQVSFINCDVMADAVDGRGPRTDFTHTCDTAGGSSGSPIFDKDGHLVGLHHYGFAEGQVEQWHENRGVRFHDIYAWMQQGGLK